MRCIDEPIRSAAIQTIVEDSEGVAERLALYNISTALQANDFVPDGVVFALKEPYYEQTNQGGCIRVDHPSDVVFLPPWSSPVPESFHPSETKSALQWKDEGNAIYGSKSYLKALRTYDLALAAISDAASADGAALRRLILRNITMVQIYLGRFESALADAKEATFSEGQANNPDDVKKNTTAFYRAGRAAYELHQYSDAEALFKKALELSPGDQDSTKELKKVEDRVKESQGEYDFTSMSKQTSKKTNRLDRADFTSKTKVKSAGEGRGRGLFAAKDFKSGELIMCEKALSVSFDSDPGSMKNYTILDSSTQKGASDTTAGLLYQLTDKLTNSPSTAERFFDLDDGGFSPRTPLTPIDGVVPADTFRILSIIHHNCYGCPTVRSSSNTAQAQLASSKGYPSSGVWVHASYINHACNGNAMRSFIGDMIIVRATRDIKEGDEICMPYRLPNPDNSVTQGELQKIWGFKCDCSLCRVEAATMAREKRTRTETVERAAELLSKNQIKEGAKADKKAIEQATKMYDKLEKTYDTQKFDHMPRPGLVGLGLWLCQAYASNENHDKLLKCALRLLRDLGFDVSAEKGQLSVKRDNCLLEPRVVDAAMFVANAYGAKGGLKTSDQVLELAKSFYEILNAEMRGFDERYASK